MFSLSRFQTLLKGLPRFQFDRIVKELDGDKYTKKFGCWNLLTVQVYGQVSGAKSLRELEAGLNVQENHHYHLDIGKISRATVSDSAKSRNPMVFERAAKLLMAKASRQIRRQGEECLQLLDSTSLTLKGGCFDAWTAGNRTRHTQGMKLHVQLDLAQGIPVQQSITAPNVNDLCEARKLAPMAKQTYVFDKGYYDFNWWARLDAAGALFVTRLKNKAKTEIVSKRKVPKQADAILADETITLSNKNRGGGRKNLYTKPLRRITVARPDHATPLVLVTNDMKRTASEIADCYRARWQIELFFKWVKQNLRIKQFYGESENAVRIQILCALITYLLIALYRVANGFTDSYQIALVVLRAALFQREQTDKSATTRRKRKRDDIQKVQGVLFA